MKLYKFQVQVTGFIDKTVKAEDIQQAHDMLANRFDFSTPLSDLDSKCLELTLLSIDGEPT